MKELANKKLGIEKIHHIAIAVKDMDETLNIWRDKFGFNAECLFFEDLQMKEYPFFVGEVQVQLYQSTDDGRFTQWTKKHGDGCHHVCFQVRNIEETIKAIHDMGMEIIEDEPLSGSQGRHVCIKHEYTNGVEVEFLELHDHLKEK